MSPIDKPKRPCSVYNLFYQMEREFILQDLDPNREKQILNEIAEDNKRGKCVKVSTDGAERPARYRNLVLADNWFKSGKRVRKHRKTNASVGFKELNTLISAQWEAADENTKKYFKEIYDKEWALFRKQLKTFRDSQAAHALTLMQFQKQNPMGKQQAKEESSVSTQESFPGAIPPFPGKDSPLYFRGEQDMMLNKPSFPLRQSWDRANMNMNPNRPFYQQNKRQNMGSGMSMPRAQINDQFNGSMSNSMKLQIMRQNMNTPIEARMNSPMNSSMMNHRNIPMLHSEFDRELDREKERYSNFFRNQQRNQRESFIGPTSVTPSSPSMSSAPSMEGRMDSVMIATPPLNSCPRSSMRSPPMLCSPMDTPMHSSRFHGERFTGNQCLDDRMCMANSRMSPLMDPHMSSQHRMPSPENLPQMPPQREMSDLSQKYPLLSGSYDPKSDFDRIYNLGLTHALNLMLHP